MYIYGFYMASPGMERIASKQKKERKSGGKKNRKQKKVNTKENLSNGKTS